MTLYAFTCIFNIEMLKAVRRNNRSTSRSFANKILIFSKQSEIDREQYDRLCGRHFRYASFTLSRLELTKRQYTKTVHVIIVVICIIIIIIFAYRLTEVERPIDCGRRRVGMAFVAIKTPLPPLKKGAIENTSFYCCIKLFSGRKHRKRHYCIITQLVYITAIEFNLRSSSQEIYVDARQ